ncbi:hypothetical protein ABIQ69_06895 [Agromyces sp. G08B096]|uniref:Tetratricopeptide repeat protein n=1 Tax=Agromyces sp. G08B096 TaxID=3156399 RepID=A0AAU7WAH7_9MICO
MDASTSALPADPSRHLQGEEQHVIDRLWDFSDPAKSEERFREAADDDSYSVHVRQSMATQLARAIGIQGRFDEGLAVLDAVAAELSASEPAADQAAVEPAVNESGADEAAAEPEAAESGADEASGEPEDAAGRPEGATDQPEDAAGRADEASEPAPSDAAAAGASDQPDEAARQAAAAEAAEVRARVALERGRLLTSAGRPAEAVPVLTRAARDAAHAGSAFLVLDALHMLALTDAGHEREWAEQGFELLAADRDPRVLRWGVALHNNLGWTLHDGGDAEAGLAEFQLAVEFADRYGTTDQQHVTRWSVGRALRTLGRTDEALALQRELARAKPDDPYVAGEIEALTAGDPTIEE